MAFDAISEAILSAPDSPSVHDEEVSGSRPECNFDALVDSITHSHTPRKLKDFFDKANLAQLTTAEYEKYLNCLEKAFIITARDKDKQLFLICSRRGDSEWGLQYLEHGSINPQTYLVELLAAENAPIDAIHVLASKGINLQNSHATIPNLLQLLELGVSPDLIRLNSKLALLWAFEMRDENLVTEICTKSPIIDPAYLTNPLIISFMQACNWIAQEQITPIAILHKFHTLGANLVQHKAEFFSLAVKSDDVALARILLDYFQTPGLEGSLTPLHLACNVPEGQQVVHLLLDEGAEVDAEEEKTLQRPLHLAVSAGNTATASILIERGSNIFREDKNGISPLQLMLLSKCPKMRAILLSSALHLRVWPLDYWVPILKAVQAQDRSPELHKLLEMIVPKYNFTTLHGRSAIELFYQLARLEVWDGIRSMLSKSFNVHLADETGESAFSRLLASKMCPAIAFLVKEKCLDPNTKTADSLPLFFYAVEQKDDALIKALIESQVDTLARGKDQETLLHFAVRKKDLKCVNWCIATLHMDVNLLDANKRPALYYALSPMQSEVASALIKAGALPFCLADRFANYSIFIQQGRWELVFSNFSLWENYKNQGPYYSQYFAQIAQQSPREALEMHFLVQFKGVTGHHLFQTKAEYLRALQALRIKYPQAPLEYFYNFLTHISAAHLQRKVTNFSIPQIAHAVDLTYILTEFETLNWTDPSLPDYLDPENVQVMGEKKIKKNLFDSLRAVITNYIPNRTYYTGTPLAGDPTLHVFYANLENLYKNIVLLLKETTDQKLRAKSLLKLAWSTMACGARWEETAVRVLQKLQFRKKPLDLLEDKFDEDLCKLREGIARAIANHSTHGYRQVVRYIGEEFNIRTLQGIADVNEPGELRHLTPGYCKYSFSTSYNAPLVVQRTREFFRKCIQKNDGVLRNWIVKHVPASFTFDGYEALSYAIAAIPLLYSTPQEQRAAMQHLFWNKGEGLYVQKDTTPEDALQNLRSSEYLGTKFYDVENDVILMDAVIDFLIQRQVLCEIFPGIFMDFVNSWQGK